MNAQAEKANIRQPLFADDRWYSAQTSKLKTDVENYINDAPTPPDIGLPIGLVAPHAGYFFSGHVAAASFATLKANAIETVILLGPDHRGAALGRISTPKVDLWRTPLGAVPVDWELLTNLQPKFPFTTISADEEHSLEVELPFLQFALKQFKLAPLMMGTQKLSICRQLAENLAQLIDAPERVLLVASSDLSHFFDDDTARQLDEETLQFALNMDAAGLLQHVETARRRNQPLACGAGPIATVMLAAQALGATQAHLLKYATSADAYPDKSRVVGYAAIAFTKE